MTEDVQKLKKSSPKKFDEASTPLVEPNSAPPKKIEQPQFRQVDPPVIIAPASAYLSDLSKRFTDACTAFEAGDKAQLKELRQEISTARQNALAKLSKSAEEQSFGQTDSATGKKPYSLSSSDRSAFSLLNSMALQADELLSQSDILTAFQGAKEGQKITLIYTSEDTNTDQTVTGTLKGKFQDNDTLQAGDNYGLVLTLPDGTQLELANTKENPNKIKKIEIQPPEDEKPALTEQEQQPAQQRVAFEATVRDTMKTFASVSQAQAEKSAGISARNKNVRLKRQQDEEKTAAENARKQEQARLEAEASASKEAEHVKEITWSPGDYIQKYESSSSYNTKSAIAVDQYTNTKDDSIFKLLYQELMDEKDHIFVRIGNNLRTAVPKEVDPTTGRKTYDVSEKDSNDMKLIVQKLTDLQERYLQLTGKKLQLPTEFSSS